MTPEKTVRYFVDEDGLPDGFPTHGHEAAFWESLGRAVATFGFLEEILEKAIFLQDLRLTFIYVGKIRDKL